MERRGDRLLERARAGDERAFETLVSPHLRELQAHCYRMLGSVTDAEDLLQETLAAAWGALDRFAGRSSLRAWLYRVATNRCLNAIRDSRRRPAAEPMPPFVPPEPTCRGEVSWLQPWPDSWLNESPGPEARYLARESIELAFIVALQHLPPRQTATLLLRDVVGFTTIEVADLLETSPTVVKGLLQRARASVANRRDLAASGVPASPDATDDHTLAQAFAAAFVSDDFDAMMALLTDDAWLAMPPAPHEYHGRVAIDAFLRASSGWRGPGSSRLLPARANGQPAYGVYLRHPGETRARGAGMLVLTMRNGAICGITRFLDAGLLRAFALPDWID